MNNKNLFAKAAIWIVIAFVLFTVFKQFDGAKRLASSEQTTSYTQFMDEAKDGKIKRVDVQGRTLTVTPSGEGPLIRLRLRGDLWMVEDLRKAGVQVYGQPDEEQSFLATLFISWFPMLLLIGVWIFLHASDAGRRKRRCLQLLVSQRLVCSTAPAIILPLQMSPAAMKQRKRSRNL